MRELYDELLNYLKLEDKEKSVDLCVCYLEKEEIDVVNLYESVLTPALNQIICEHEDDPDNLIWKEHVRSGIIRTIIEIAYPFVLKDRNKTNAIKNEDVIIMCPRYEEHDIGARMVSDFFTIAGYNATFIGANTPEKTIIKAIEYIKPKYVTMSVTNYYNVVTAKKTIDLIKSKIDYKVIFLLGGNAFSKNPSVYKDIGGDFLINNYNEILSLNKEVVKFETSI